MGSQAESAHFESARFESAHFESALSTSYRLLEPLGRGSMGEVFAARHERLGHRVVVKVLHSHVDERLADRLRLEAQALARVRHDNVVAVLDSDTTPEGRPFLVMEHLEGTTLDRYLEQSSGLISVDEALDMTRQTLAGLHAVHEAGFVHRDVKPHNLFRCTGGRIKLLDLGVLKMLQHVSGVAPLASSTSEGALVGTPKYMAPEQALHDPVDRRADLYAVGVVLYKMLTGVTPFDHYKSLAEMLYAQAYEPPRRPSELAPHRVSAKLDRVVMRALAKRPEERFPDALAMAAELVMLDRSYELLASELGFEPVDSTVPMGERLELDLEAKPTSESTRRIVRPAEQTGPSVRSEIDATVVDPLLSAGVLLEEPAAPQLQAPLVDAPEDPSSAWADPMVRALFVGAALVSALATIALGITGVLG